jgi:hypothetical protein
VHRRAAGQEHGRGPAGWHGSEPCIAHAATTRGDAARTGRRRLVPAAWPSSPLPVARDHFRPDQRNASPNLPQPTAPGTAPRTASVPVRGFTGRRPRAHGRMTDRDSRGNDQRRSLRISGAYGRIGASGSVNRTFRLLVQSDPTTRTGFMIADAVRYMSAHSWTQWDSHGLSGTSSGPKQQPARPGKSSSRAISAGGGRCWVRTNVG